MIMRIVGMIEWEVLNYVDSKLNWAPKAQIETLRVSCSSPSGVHQGLGLVSITLLMIMVTMMILGAVRVWLVGDKERLIWPFPNNAHLLSFARVEKNLGDNVLQENFKKYFKTELLAEGSSGLQTLSFERWGHVTQADNCQLHSFPKTASEMHVATRIFSMAEVVVFLWSTSGLLVVYLWSTSGPLVAPSGPWVVPKWPLSFIFAVLSVLFCYLLWLIFDLVNLWFSLI